MYLQRVLEHCRKPATQSAVMNEIVQHAFSLTEDKYGNYVVQVCQYTLYMTVSFRLSLLRCSSSLGQGTIAAVLPLLP